MARAPSVHSTFRIELKGDFFASDPRLTLRQNVRALMDEVAEEGARVVRSDYLGHAGSMPAWTGWTLGTIKGRTRNRAGKRWALTAVISANTDGMSRRDAIRTKAAASGIEARWHPFRKTANDLRSARAVLYADLTKGMD